MTRRGKIARLPRLIRHDLNLRLDDGEQARDLVRWLNSLDHVKELLDEEFDGRPINEQNLSEWKQGGFLDWQRQQQTCENIRQFVDHSEDLIDAADHADLSIQDRLAAVLAAELAAETQKLLAQTADPAERWRCLCQAIARLNELRRADYAGFRAAIARDRLNAEIARREEEEKDRVIKAAREDATAPLFAALKRPTMVAAFGGGEAAEKAVDYLDKIDAACREMKSSNPLFGKPVKPRAPSPPGDPTDPPIKPDQGQSNLIKVNQAQKNNRTSLPSRAFQENL